MRSGSVGTSSASTYDGDVPAVENVEPDLRRADDDIGVCQFLLKSLDFPKVDFGPDETFDPRGCLFPDDAGLLRHQRRRRSREDDERLFSSVSGAAENSADQQDGDERLAGTRVSADDTGENSRRISDPGAVVPGIQSRRADGFRSHVLLDGLSGRLALIAARDERDSRHAAARPLRM